MVLDTDTYNEADDQFALVNEESLSNSSANTSTRRLAMAGTSTGVRRAQASTNRCTKRSNRSPRAVPGALVEGRFADTAALHEPGIP